MQSHQLLIEEIHVSQHCTATQTRFVMLPVLFIFGCDNDDDNDNNDPQLQSSYVRVAHLSPDAPAVDVWVDGNIVLEDVAYNGVSSYLN